MPDSCYKWRVVDEWCEIHACSVMIRTSQQRDRQQPPAGQAPLMAAMVTKGERYSRARNTFEVTQNSRYLHKQQGSESLWLQLPYKQKGIPI